MSDRMKQVGSVFKLDMIEYVESKQGRRDNDRWGRISKWSPSNQKKCRKGSNEKYEKVVRKKMKRVRRQYGNRNVWGDDTKTEDWDEAEKEIKRKESLGVYYASKSEIALNF